MPDQRRITGEIMRVFCDNLLTRTYVVSAKSSMQSRVKRKLASQ
jgi:hypothetical protein